MDQDGAVLSGMAAGRLLGILKRAAPPPEVLTPTERRIEGVITRRARRIDRRDATTWRGIPMTSAVTYGDVFESPEQMLAELRILVSGSS